MEKITKNFEITADEEVMNKIERFLALIHYNSHFGHSAIFGMALDGDGNGTVEISNLNKSLAKEVDLIGGVGYDIEIATPSNYSGSFLDRNKESKWYTKPSYSLVKSGSIVKTLYERQD